MPCNNRVIVCTVCVGVISIGAIILGSVLLFNDNEEIVADSKNETSVNNYLSNEKRICDHPLNENYFKYIKNSVGSTETKFSASEEVTEIVREIPWKSYEIFHVIQKRPDFPKTDTLIQYSTLGDRVYPSFGFSHTVLRCYKHHHNLVIRPDDIWMAIMVQFSLYVNFEENSEELRSQFVDHSGKIKLSVKLHGSAHTASYSDFVKGITQKLSTSLKNDTKDWAVPNFTTTTEEDKIVYGIVLMSTMQKYFDYEAFVACGIPEITLLGTLKDWQDISERAKRLQTFGIETQEWYKLLKPVLDQFVEAKRGRIDRNFWMDICRVHSTSNYLGTPETYLDGWISVFNVFNKDGKFQGEVGPKDIYPKINFISWAPGSVKVNISIVNNENTYNASLFAGHIGHTVLQDEKTIEPYSGWALVINENI